MNDSPPPGTSMATAHVSVAAALVIRAMGRIGPEAVKDQLIAYAEHPDNFTTEQQGAGLIDAWAAVQVFELPANYSP